MTRAEVIENLKELLYCTYVDSFEDAENEALEIAIKAFEQGPCAQIMWERDTAIAQLKELGYGLGEKPRTDVLDKIRVEIEQITDTMGVSYNQYVSKIDVLHIIDKYKAESEEDQYE